MDGNEIIIVHYRICIDRHIRHGGSIAHAYTTDGTTSPRLSNTYTSTDEMKRLLALLFVTLMAVPAFAEDKEGGTVIFTPKGGGTTTLPASSGQILGSFGTTPEWETLSGGSGNCALTRTTAGIYELDCPNYVTGGTGAIINNATINNSTLNNTTFTGTVTLPNGSITDVELANPYSGIGPCPAGQFVNALTRNAPPTCAAITTLSGVTINNVTITGVTDGTDAKAGTVGEFVTISGQASTPAFEQGMPGFGYTVAGTLNLTPGDWDVYANFYTLISIAGGTVTNGIAWWGVLLPSSIPLGATDGTLPSANVAWIGGASPNEIMAADGGTIGPVRFSQATAGSMDVRVVVQGTSGAAIIYWTISARRMR